MRAGWRGAFAQGGLGVFANWKVLLVAIASGAVALLAAPASAAAAPPSLPEPAQWLQNHRATTVWARGDATQALAPAPQWTHFRVAGPQVGMRLPVFDARLGVIAWIEALDVGPSGPPVEQSLTKPPPAAPPPAAPPPAAPPLDASPPPIVAPPPGAQPAGLAAVAVAPPRRAPKGVGLDERWIDVDVRAQRLHLIEGERVVATLPVTTGKAGFATPTGTFRIFHRVQSETMDSATLGVAREATEGYLHKDVRFTQYFADGGYALHANHWQPPTVFGKVPTSHGCIGMSQGDALQVWEFAGAGTVVSVH